MKPSLLKNFFSSGVQAIAVQVLGIFFFFIAADYLSKDSFGIVNWANATSVILAIFVGFGLEQVVIRRIAASKSSDWAAAAYLFHTLITSVFTFLVLFLVTRLFLPGDEYYERVVYLPWFFAVQGLVYMCIPLKQFLNAKQNFTPYAVIAFVSNIVKILLVIFFVKMEVLSIPMVAMILAICGIIELFSLLIYLMVKTNFSFKFKFVAYYKLLKESFPQYISTIFDTSLSRIDWLLLGILSTTAVTADYSVAYKAFEVSRLPLAVISPILLNIFAKKMLSGARPDAPTQALIQDLYTLEIFLAMLLPLTLNILWSPVVDQLFKGKYGNVNAIPFMILSLAIPLMFIINLLWTLGFSVKKYKQISFIIFLGAVLNFVLNLFLIPIYQATGAAIAFLITVASQIFFYYRLVDSLMTFSIKTPLMLYAIGFVSYFLSGLATPYFIIRLPVAVLIYLILAVLTKSVGRRHLHTIQYLLKK